MFTRLLVGHDGSSAARVALAQAIRIGRQFRATITVAQLTAPRLLGAAVGRGRGAWAGAGSRTGGRRADDLFDGLQVELAESGVATVVVPTEGDPVLALHRLSRDSDVVVVGRGRGPGQVGGAPLSPESKDLIKVSPVPVIVCGSSVSAFDHCAVAYDETETGERALMLAARYAGITNAKMEIVHAASDPDAGEAVLAWAAALLSEHPIRFDTHRETGDVHTALSRALTRLGCNALFVGGHRDSRRLSVPSHTEAILRATDIPVLVHN